MIANDQEFAIVSRQLHELKAQRDHLLRGGNGQPLPLHVEVAGIEKMIARLQAEVDAYQSHPSRPQAPGDRRAGSGRGGRGDRGSIPADDSGRK